MAGTATTLTAKIRRQVREVSQDKLRGPVVRRLRSLFANAPELRSGRIVGDAQNTQSQKSK